MIQIDQSLLQHLPVGLVLIADHGKIAWANDTAIQILDAREDLVGRSPAELPQSARRLLTGEGDSAAASDTPPSVERAQYDDQHGRRLLVLSDVGAQARLADENARLRQQLEDLKLTDDLTGLPNKRAISQALELHISRSRRYQNPLSIVLVHVDLQARDGVRALSREPLTVAVSHFLRDRLRWVDQIARWDDELFLLVLPETDEDDARRLVEKIETEQHSMQLPKTGGEFRPHLAFGMACWKKGDDMRILLRTALRDLQDRVGD